MLLTDAIKFARRKTGCLSKSELTNQSILEDLLPMVLHDLSCMGPRVGQHTLQLLPDVTYYTPPSPDILFVRYAQNHKDTALSDEIHDPAAAATAGLLGHRVDRYSSPQVARVAREIECPPPKFTVDLKGGQIRVFPTPDHTITIHLHTDDRWNLRYTMETIVADGSSQTWVLDDKFVWDVEVEVDGEEVWVDDVELTRLGGVTRVALDFVPAAGQEVVISYQTPRRFDELLPTTHHQAFMWLLASTVAEIVGLKRS